MKSQFCVGFLAGFATSTAGGTAGAQLYLPLNITGLALQIFSKLSGTDTGSPEATTGKVTEAGPTKPGWGTQGMPVPSRNRASMSAKHGKQGICSQSTQHPSRVQNCCLNGSLLTRLVDSLSPIFPTKRHNLHHTGHSVVERLLVPLLCHSLATQKPLTHPPTHMYTHVHRY